MHGPLSIQFPCKLASNYFSRLIFYQGTLITDKGKALTEHLPHPSEYSKL